jgi:hypothetical protein
MNAEKIVFCSAEKERALDAFIERPSSEWQL